MTEAQGTTLIDLATQQAAYQQALGVGLATIWHMLGALLVMLCVVVFFLVWRAQAASQ